MLTAPRIAEVDVGAESEPAAVSSDGTFVLVASQADDLLPGLEVPYDVPMHLFRYEIGTSEPELVDRPWFAGPSTAAFHGVEHVSIISGDGSSSGSASRIVLPAIPSLHQQKSSFIEKFLLEVDSYWIRGCCFHPTLVRYSHARHRKSRHDPT